MVGLLSVVIHRNSQQAGQDYPLHRNHLRKERDTYSHIDRTYCIRPSTYMQQVAPLYTCKNIDFKLLSQHIWQQKNSINNNIQII